MDHIDVSELKRVLESMLYKRETTLLKVVMPDGSIRGVKDVYEELDEDDTGEGFSTLVFELSDKAITPVP